MTHKILVFLMLVATFLVVQSFYTEKPVSYAELSLRTYLKNQDNSEAFQKVFNGREMHFGGKCHSGSYDQLIVYPKGSEFGLYLYAAPGEFVNGYAEFDCTVIAYSKRYKSEKDL